MSIEILQERVRRCKSPVLLGIGADKEQLSAPLLRQFTDLYGDGPMAVAEALLMGEHEGAVHEVTVHSHELIIVACLEILPGEVIVLGLGRIGGEHIAQYILLPGEVHEILVQPHRPVA